MPNRITGTKKMKERETSKRESTTRKLDYLIMEYCMFYYVALC